MTTEMVVGSPAPRLRQFVRSYVGYRQDDVTLGLHRGLPSHSVTVVISLADPVRFAGGPGISGGPAAFQAAVGGLHLAPVLISQDRFQHGIHLELNPLGVRALLGVSATELSSALCDVTDLPVSWRKNLIPRLHDAPDWPTRFSLLDNELSRALHPVTLVSEIQWAWRKMVETRGAHPVSGLAEEIGWSRRHFSERFAREVGVSPKQAARLMRFERSGAMLRAGGYRNLADVANACGYYDQAHMTGEWREFAGCAPSTWIAEELPFLQATTDTHGAD